MHYFKAHLTKYAHCYFLFFASWFPLVGTIESDQPSFSSSDLIALFIYTSVVMAIQCMVCRSITRPVFQQTAASILLICNIFLFHVIFNSGFHASELYIQVILFSVGFFVFFTLFKMIAENFWAAVTLPVLALSAVLMSVFQMMAPLDIPPSGASASLPDSMRMVDFAQKPNVYFLSFDALVPASILRKYLNAAPGAYQDVLDAAFLRFPNFFANATLTSAAPTKRSLNMLLAMDPELFEAATQQRRQFGYFPGLESSPLLHIFRHNGYTTNTYHYSPYLGAVAGPFVDNYFFSRFFTTCELVDAHIKAYAFLGYCLLQDSLVFKSALSLLGGSTKNDHTDLLISHMRTQRQTRSPQFFLSYIFSPGHTSRWFNYNDPAQVEKYRQTFSTSSKATASDIQKIIDFISKEDPQAIIFVFGDHGMFLSRSTRKAEHEVFFVQDRLAVYGGIYPKDRCRDHMSGALSGVASTVNQVALMILSCLSDGKHVFIQPPVFRIHGESRSGPGEDYQDYLYE